MHQAALLGGSLQVSTNAKRGGGGGDDLQVSSTARYGVIANIPPLLWVADER